MELRHIRNFIVLADELSFSKAASKLCITQGTLSQQIRQLEYEIGAELFERTSHHVMLTEAGEELLPAARKTLNAAFECSQIAIDLSRGTTGTLRIGVTHSFKYFLRSTVKEFIGKYPGIRLKITYSTATDLLTQLRDRKIDFFVAFRPDAEFADIESVSLFNSQLSVIMRRGHPLADRQSLTLEEMRRHPIALPSAGLQSRKAVDLFIGSDSAGMNVAVETNDPNILLEIISTTNLLSITSTLAITYRPDLVSIPLMGLNKTMTGCIHRLKGVYVKHSAKLFFDMLVESARLERITGSI